MRRRPKIRDLTRLLRRLGCRPLAPHGGSHQKWVTPGGQSFPIVIDHPGADVTRTVLTSVRRVLRREGLVLEAA
ncbi:type II toxin-antitoxin system HicA family toxin [Archangium sp. Cb G35]|uniref:type II toxin-antitoxin system HicA family toxin n=1 Tax=Archangium sp. Cb G35 TaxID=1920190 RepID=UPI0009371B6D